MEDLKEGTIGVNTAGEKKTGQSYNYSDQELIRQLAKSRMVQGQELEYEDLSGYELPPRTQFSMLSKPVASIKYGKITFNMACIRMFDDALYVLTPINKEKKRLMVVPCKEEEAASLQWARVKSDGNKANRTITSEEFVYRIFNLMEWKLHCRYQVLGRVAILKPSATPVLIFDLEEAVMYDTKPVEWVNEETGEIKKKQVKYYPEEYKNCFGKSYADYVEGKQMTMFEFMEGYTGQSYSDLKEETAADNTDSDTASNTSANTAGTSDEGRSVSMGSGIQDENSVAQTVTSGGATDE